MVLPSPCRFLPALGCKVGHIAMTLLLLVAAWLEEEAVDLRWTRMELLVGEGMDYALVVLVGNGGQQHHNPDLVDFYVHFVISCRGHQQIL